MGLRGAMVAHLTLDQEVANSILAVVIIIFRTDFRPDAFPAPYLLKYYDDTSKGKQLTTCVCGNHHFELCISPKAAPDTRFSP